MLKQQTCIDCGRSFMGGPRAWRCPVCRVERAKQTHKEHKKRKQAGHTRALGSEDYCERCGKLYTVDGGLQRFCQDCQLIHNAEYDRRTSLEFYKENKTEINPSRNQRRKEQRRKNNIKKCAWCGNEFVTMTGEKTCSDECRRLRINQSWRENQKKRTAKAPSRD